MYLLKLMFVILPVLTIDIFSLYYSLKILMAKKWVQTETAATLTWRLQDFRPLHLGPTWSISEFFLLHFFILQNKASFVLAF